MIPVVNNNGAVEKQSLPNKTAFKIAGFACLVLISLTSALYFTVVTRFFPQDKYPLLLTLTSFLIVILLVLFFTFFWKYIKADELICRTLFLSYARQFGADENKLREFEKPEYGRRRIPGVWASVPVCYNNRDFIFAAENIEVPSGHGCLSYFSIATTGAEREGGPKTGILPQLDPKSREILEEMQKRLKRFALVRENNGLSCKILMSPKVTVRDLRTAMDILLSI